jgi:hypothetical protein
MLAGVALVVVGALVWGLSKLGLSLGRLPGDFRIERGNFTCFAPLASTIVISLLLTVLLNLILRWLNR